MEILKQRSESLELRIMRYLNIRLALDPQERKNYLYLEKGYIGEVMFDLLTGKLENDLFILNDLCLKVNSQVFQIDTMIISQDTIYPIEVKNYEGDHYYDPKTESFHTIFKKEIKNPLEQLKRSKSLLRQLLQNYGYHLPLEGYVVFVNSEFTLFQAPLNTPIILPTQLNYFMKKFNQLPSRLNGLHKKLADLLISLHIINSPYTRLPPYEYGQLKKGPTCALCQSFSIIVHGQSGVCGNCGYEERLESVILRNVEELKLLFPDWKITTSGVYEWCDGTVSKKAIRRVLKKSYRAVEERKLRYFE